MRLAGLLSIFAAGFAPLALACGFHGYTPQETAVERMLASYHIVLARPSEDDRFRFKAVEALEGGLENVDIPYLVDSASRRRLAANPDDAVLFAREGSDGEWRRLAYVDAEYRALIDKVVARLPDWELSDDADRYQMFADLHDHPDRDIRTLALLELDRADYGILRALEIRPDAKALRAGLDDLSEMYLAPIRVLLIGLSGDADARGLLAGGVKRTSVIGTPVLGAYATAWLELDGAEAARALADGYLKTPTTPPKARELIVEAMAIHRLSGDEATRNAIGAELKAAVAEAPHLAPAVARQFGLRSVWSLRDALAEALARNAIRSAADLIAVSRYISLASDGDTN